MNILISNPCQQVYKAWVNCCLDQIGDKRTVHDLAEDLKDGIVLCQLIKSTTGHDTTQYQQVNKEVHYTPGLTMRAVTRADTCYG